MSYDPDCEKVVQGFLLDCNLSTEKYGPRMAQVVQDAIEAELAVIEEEEHNIAKADPPQ